MHTKVFIALVMLASFLTMAGCENPFLKEEIAQKAAVKVPRAQTQKQTPTPLKTKPQAQPITLPKVFTKADGLKCLLFVPQEKFNAGWGEYELLWHKTDTKSYLKLNDPEPGDFRMKREPVNSTTSASYKQKTSETQLKLTIENFLKESVVQEVIDQKKEYFMEEEGAFFAQEKDRGVIKYICSLTDKPCELHIISDGTRIGVFDLFDLSGAADEGLSILNALKNQMCE